MYTGRYTNVFASQINSLKHRLVLCRQILERIVPGKVDLVPHPDKISIEKLGEEGTVTTDNCNTAQKVRRILVNVIDGTLEYDCVNHLRNVWLGNMERKLTKELNRQLRMDLDEIDPRLRVTSLIRAIICAVDKQFSLPANYPKGHGELFLEWIREKYPGQLLLHVE